MSQFYFIFQILHCGFYYLFGIVVLLFCLRWLTNTQGNAKNFFTKQIAQMLLVIWRRDNLTRKAVEEILKNVEPNNHNMHVLKAWNI